jgi:hypothetical protein
LEEGPLTMSETAYDPMTLARFAAKPGSNRIMEIYIRMPDVLIDKWVHDGLFLINTVNMPPPVHPMDPLVAALEHEAAGGAGESAPEEQRALEAPDPGRRRVAKAPKDTAPLEERVVFLRMQGDDAATIAHKLDIDVGVASKIILDAREIGKIQFPKKSPKPSSAGKSVFHTELKFIPMGTRSKLAASALKYGMSLQQIVAARKLFVEMRSKNRAMDDIAKATKIPEKDLWSWLYKARASGLDLPLDVGFQDAQMRPVLPIRPADAPIRLKTHAACVAAKMTGAAYKIEHAASSRGLSIPDYEYMREVVLDMALAGTRQTEIAEAVGEPTHWVSGVLSYALKYGIVIPESVRQTTPATRAKMLAAAAERETQAPTMPAPHVALLATLKPLDQIADGARFVIEQAAKKRGIAPEAYLQRRETAIRLRLDGLDLKAIGAQIGEDPESVRSWCTQAEKQSGARFPFLGRSPPQHQPLAAE